MPALARVWRLGVLVLSALVVLAASAGPTPVPSVRGLVVLGLGDSVTAASHCGCAGFVQDYADIVRRRTGRAVTAVNLGQGGQTSAGLLRELAQDGTMARQVSTSAVVLLTIGANDFYPQLRAWRAGGCGRPCWLPQAAVVQRNVDAIVTRIHQLRGARPTLVLVTDYWNLFEDGQVGFDDFGKAFLTWSDALTRSVNGRICAGAVLAGARCTDLYVPFKAIDGSKDPSPLLAEDGDHPDAAGHEVIARALADTALPPRT